MENNEESLRFFKFKVIASNNQRLGSAGDNDWRSKYFCKVTDGQNMCDQIMRGRRWKCA